MLPTKPLTPIDMPHVKLLLSSSVLLLLVTWNNLIDSPKAHNTHIQPHANILTTEEWQEDLDELFRLLKTQHRDLYFATEPAEFEQLYTQIKKKLPALADHEIIAQFARLAALTHDGHTRLTLPLAEGIGLSQAHSKTPLPVDSALVFRHLPIEFYGFDDGLHVIKATTSYQHLIGKKVLAINDMPIEEALAQVRAFCHYDNESGYRLMAPSRLSIWEMLRALKIIGEKEELFLTIEKEKGIQKERILPLPRFTSENFLEQNPRENPESLMLSRQRNREYYWYQYLENKKCIYLQINQMNAASSGPGLIRFLGDLHAFIRTHEVERLILDLRNNFGGSNGYSLPIADLIIKNPNLNRIGNFYTLIGRKTFSAAQFLVNDLGRWTNVIFVGEPTGASPSHYGDSKKKRLPNSNLTLRVSSIYWRDADTDEYKKQTSPDIPVQNNAADYFQQKDQSLALSLNYQTSDKLADTYRDLYKQGGKETAERLYLRIATDWTRTDDEISVIEEMLIKWFENNPE